VSRQLANGYLIGGLLEFDDLLVDKLGLLMHDEIGVHRAFLCRVAWCSLPAAHSGEGDTTEATLDMNILNVSTIAALNMKLGGFGRHDGSTDDDTRHSDQPRDGKRVQVPNRDILGVGVQQQLVLGKVYFGLVREDDSVGASLEGLLELQGRFVSSAIGYSMRIEVRRSIPRE